MWTTLLSDRQLSADIWRQMVIKLELFRSRIGKDDASITKLGEPRLAFSVCRKYGFHGKPLYGGEKETKNGCVYAGRRDGKTAGLCNRCVLNLIRRTYKHTPIILGGIEASLRRLAHYDYWSDKVKRSILLDSGADMISYGMGEHSILEIAEALDAGISIHDITYVAGTVYRTKEGELSAYEPISLPAFEEVSTDKKKYAQSFYVQYENTDAFTAKPLVEAYPNKVLVVQNPPAKPLTTQEMDDIYAYPYVGTYHPSYEAAGGVPAISEIQFSLTSCRGCFGGCNFCALTFHQGRIVQVRSHESILEEAKG